MRWEDGHVDLFKEAMEAKLHGKGKKWTGAELDKILQSYTVRYLTSGQSSETEFRSGHRRHPMLAFRRRAFGTVPKGKSHLDHTGHRLMGTISQEYHFQDREPPRSTFHGRY